MEMANSNKLGRASSNNGFFSEHTDISPNMMKHNTPSDSAAFEFHEVDLYGSVVVEVGETNNKACSSEVAAVGRSDPPSLPVNIPDWSKILGKQYRKNDGRYEVVEEEEEEGISMVPPHEFIAKNRMASMSVQEGIGRTLKGRDLRRVRNSVWAKTGFQD